MDDSDRCDADIFPLTRDLCEHASAVVSDANDALFARLSDELPFTLHRYPSGKTYNGWTVPQNWKVLRATIHKDGQLVYDGSLSPLGVAYYSKSFQGTMSLDELKQHLVCHPKLPDALVFHCMWQYRPWEADWAMSLPRTQLEALAPGQYEVNLETEYSAGEMTVAEYHLPGRSQQTLVFNAHTCHPQMANDGFVGVATLVRIAQWLKQRDNHFSYRFIFGPEHLGTVFYLQELPAEQIENLVSGMFVEMTGTEGPLKITSTFLGDQDIDRALANAAKHHCQSTVHVPWRCGAGNDETVWEAPGYEVPFIELTRCIDQFDPYPQYHSNQDTAESMNMDHVNETFRVLQQTIDTLEQNAVIERHFDGLICLSNPQYDLYLERPDPAVVKDLEADSEKWGHLLDCLFRYFDKSMTVLDIAEKHDLPFDRLVAYLKRFEAKGLIEFHQQSINRGGAEKKAHTRRAA